MQERRQSIRGTKRWSIGLSNVVKEKVAGKAGHSKSYNVQDFDSGKAVKGFKQERDKSRFEFLKANSCSG